MQKTVVLSLTFLSYAQIHGSRTLWSYMQKYIRTDDYSVQDTGIANLVFLFTYGVCMSTLSPICCRVNIKNAVTISCLSAGLIFLVLAGLAYLDQLNFYWILCLMFLNGFAQSACYPGCIGIMGNWFKQGDVGVLMGLWSGCTNLGDIFGLIIGDLVIQRMKLDATYGFLIIGAALVVIAFFDALFLVPFPKATAVEDSLIINPKEYSKKKSNINILNAWLLPGVALYGIGFACLKGTFVGFLFWLPNYFQSYPELESQSSYIAQMFDVGTFLGGVVIGHLGDKYKKRAVYIVPSLVIAMGLMLSVKYLFGLQAWPYYLAMFGMGLFQGGPYNNISGVISIELTKQLQNDKSAISVVSSLIESAGTLTAAIFQVIIPHLGETWLFVFFAAVTSVAEMACVALMWKEIKTK